jgi:predicted Rossmann-fold nucleotide-binding protein
VFTWSQLGLHRKACALLNVAGYFDGLTSFLDHAVQERFMKAEHRAMLLCEDTPAAVLDALDRYEPPAVDKWIDRASQT